MAFRSDRHLRSGLTLLELMLVLVLVVIVVAMAVPQMSRARTSGRLRAGADQLRTGWAKARNRAMRDGVAQAFIYLPESRLYAIAPTDVSGIDPQMFQSVVQHLQQLSSADEQGQAVVLEPIYLPGLPTAATFNTGPTGMATDLQGVPIQPPAVRIDCLPDDLVLSATGPDGFTPVAMAPVFSTTPSSLGLTNTSTAGMDATMTLGMMGVQGGGAILFLPDGTCQDAVVWLRNIDGEMLPVTLRGLTGTSAVGTLVRTTVGVQGGGRP